MNKPNSSNNVIHLKPEDRSHVTGQFLIDTAMRLKRFSADAAHLINVQDTDIGKPICSITTNIKHQTLADDIRRVITTGGMISREVETISERWYQVIVLPAVQQSDDKIEGAIVTFMDITERKLDEIRKSDFIALVSHELKTPLTSVQGYVQIVLAKARSSGDSFAAGALDKANIQLKKMNALIDGFLNLSHPDAGKIHLNKKPFEINALITEIVDEARLAHRSRDIARSPCAAITVTADKDKIAQVISNLLGNAVKYSSHGTPISVTCQETDGVLQVTVADQGRGISPKDREKLFDRYYRVDHTGGQPISGFGLGLYLSSEIIKRHQGEIWVVSELGKGSSFHFRLPLF